MQYHFSPDYDTNKKMRNQELKRAMEHHYWVEQARSRKQPRPRRPWQILIATLIGFFF